MDIHKLFIIIGLIVAAGLCMATALATARETVIDLPSCPLELTLQDGTRMSKPEWSTPGCKAVIGWQVP